MVLCVMVCGLCGKSGSDSKWNSLVGSESDLDQVKCKMNLAAGCTKGHHLDAPCALNSCEFASHYFIRRPSTSRQPLKVEKQLLCQVWDGCCRGGDMALVFRKEDLGASMHPMPPCWEVGKKADKCRAPLYHVCIVDSSPGDFTKGMERLAAEDIVRVVERVAAEHPVGVILKILKFTPPKKSVSGRSTDFIEEARWETSNVMLDVAQSSAYRSEMPLLGSNPQASGEFQDWWERYSVAESMGLAALAAAVAGAMWASGRVVYPTLFALAHGNGLEQEASILNILWLLSRCLPSLRWPRTCLPSWCWPKIQGLRTSPKTLQIVVLTLAIPGLLLELEFNGIGKYVAAAVYMIYSIIQLVYAGSWLWFSWNYFGRPSLTPSGVCESAEEMLITLATKAEWRTAMLLSEVPGVRCCDKDGTLLSSMGASSAVREDGERYAHCFPEDQTERLVEDWSASIGGLDAKKFPTPAPTTSQASSPPTTQGPSASTSPGSLSP
ncbi:unnamed protein product [Chrysoparadoxa australica]